MADSAFDVDALRRVLFGDFGLPGGVRLAVGYSGGMDSHVLLHALCALRRDADFALSALHFDHGLAAESADWEARCAAVCRAWGVEYASHRRAVSRVAGASLEARARAFRYRWFARELDADQVLLTAHHADDQAETVLLNLLRGGGVESLAGIAPLRRISRDKNVRVARPLLGFSRASLHDYARRNDLQWIEDPSNQNAEFDRNFIRQEVMPLLRQRWHGAVRSLSRAAENCRDTAGFLDEVMTPILLQCEAPKKRGVFCVAPPLDVRALKMFGRFHVIALLREWIHRHGRRSPSSAQLQDFYRQVFSDENLPSDCHASLFWDESELHYFNGDLYLIRRLKSCAENAPIKCEINADDDKQKININGLCLEINRDADGDINPQSLRGKSLKLARRNGGERITLPGRKHTSAIKKLYQQNAVPPWERDELPLLFADDEIAWAHGIGAAEFCAVKNAADNDNKVTPIRLRFVSANDSNSPEN